MAHSKTPVDADSALLTKIQIAAPCHVDWDSMTGDERKRFCGDCKLNVFNISEMSTKDAAALIRESEGRACLRLYRRADGTVITDNCPVGLRKVRDRMIKTAAAVVAYLIVVGLLSDPAQACEPTRAELGGASFVPQGTSITMGVPATVRVAPSFVESYGWLLNIAGILSSIGLIVLTLLKKTQPTTIGLMLLAIWAFTGFIIGIIAFATPYGSVYH